MSNKAEYLAKEALVDVRVEFNGSLCLFRPQTKDAEDWLEEHTDGQWFGNALVVEPRYAGDLAQGLREEGFTLS